MNRWALLNGNIITLCPHRPRAQALLIEEERIQFVGNTEEVLRELGAGQHLDLAGATVLPGFIDCHVHPIWTGMACQGADLVGAKSLDELLNRLAGWDKKFPGPTWLFGNGYDESTLAEARPPSRAELDSVSTTRPILVRQRGGHSCVVNTAGLRILNLPPETPGIVRTPTGEPTGLLIANALTLALSRAGEELDPESLEQAICATCDLALHKGVTTLHALQKTDPRHYQTVTLLSAKPWPIHLLVYPTTLDAEWAAAHGFTRVGGCILLDGALEAHTAALFEPYTDAPDNYGTLYLSDEVLRAFVHRAHELGLQVCLHAVAERAIEQALSAYAQASANTPRRDSRHRIEHFILPTDAQIARAAELGVCVCAQPAFELLWGGKGRWFDRLIGERWQRTTPLRKMLDAGVLVAAGSDSYVTPIDPLLGIHAAVNHPNPDQRLSVMEAIRLFTTNAAAIAFQEASTGQLVPGRVADLVVLADDPTAAPPEYIKDIPVIMTVVGGKIRFANSARFPSASCGDKR